MTDRCASNHASIVLIEQAWKKSLQVQELSEKARQTFSQKRSMLGGREETEKGRMPKIETQVERTLSYSAINDGATQPHPQEENITGHMHQPESNEHGLNFE
ncbi:hypothetical protein CAPTEDRAFT_191568 [Capitella teleta]|uniref:Uncharacterized protein n=1 Tax=Capitella teleta TaxID=283909 RepID=R7TY11_CAPTE|nr:hypothetical protein CAPTEDRAFT_191568 [Capitella teleta]|eukprot:ELT98527.1 hypothetical protein CAPTEDRAFT_191568 [Capitella teleta]